MYVCMYVFTHVTYVWMDVRMYVCMYVRMSHMYGWMSSYTKCEKYLYFIACVRVNVQMAVTKG